MIFPIIIKKESIQLLFQKFFLLALVDFLLILLELRVLAWLIWMKRILQPISLKCFCFKLPVNIIIAPIPMSLIVG